jgi:hypothetical protein
MMVKQPLSSRLLSMTVNVLSGIWNILNPVCSGQPDHSQARPCGQGIGGDTADFSDAAAGALTILALTAGRHGTLLRSQF